MTPARRIVSTGVAVLISFLLLISLIIQARYTGVALGLIPTARVDTSQVAPAEMLNSTTVVAEYCSEATSLNNLSITGPSAGRTSTPLTFDDTWFTHSAYEYHHDLATACAVLTAVCNSESQFYSNVAGAEPYAEQTLTALGFSDIRTESYALRSNILDEVGAFFAGTHDVAAYTFASKTIEGPNDEPYTLIFVGIRGSYGVEWLSNFNIADTTGNASDHHGFATAEDEVQRALAAYAREIGTTPETTRILITGHSRGGAIANLLAARLNTSSTTSTALAPAEGIYTYTFASPGCTRSAEYDDERFGTIFNVVNEADIVPQLPLSIWGYARYGTTVALPSASSSGFDTSYAAMRSCFERNTGIELTCDAESLAALNSFEDQVAHVLPSPDALASPAGIVGTVQTLLGTDTGAALMSHCPDAYIAWMQSLDSAHLSFDSPAR